MTNQKKFLFKIFILLSTFLCLIFFLSLQQRVSAQDNPLADCIPTETGHICIDLPNCEDVTINYLFQYYTDRGQEKFSAYIIYNIALAVDSNPNLTYVVFTADQSSWDTNIHNKKEFKPPHESESGKTVLKGSFETDKYGQTRSLWVAIKTVGDGKAQYCGPFDYTVIDRRPTSTPTPSPTPKFSCSVQIKSLQADGSLSDLLKPIDEIYYQGDLAINPGASVKEENVDEINVVEEPKTVRNIDEDFDINATKNGDTFYLEGSLGAYDQIGHYIATIKDGSKKQCPKDFFITEDGIQPTLTPTPLPGTPRPTRKLGDPTNTPIPPMPKLKPLCQQIGQGFDGSPCLRCVEQGRIYSALGCLPLEPSVLIKEYVFTTGVGIAGGIAFLYFLYGAFLILTSAGNAEKVEQGKQIFTSSISGLLLILFSVFLLQIIGIDILRLPGFNR